MLSSFLKLLIDFVNVIVPQAVPLSILNKKKMLTEILFCYLVGSGFLASVF